MEKNDIKNNPLVKLGSDFRKMTEVFKKQAELLEKQIVIKNKNDEKQH